MNSELDREFESRFLGREAGNDCLLICRSPWTSEDLSNAPSGRQCVISVNQAILKYSLIVDYSVGSDTHYFDCVDPARFPAVTFVTGFSQERKKWLEKNRYPENVWCYTSPPQLPTGYSFPTRDYPRPNNGGQSLSSITALWLAWYMGCRKVYIAGSHFRMKGDRIHGDRKETPAGGMSVTQIREQYRTTLPQMARQFSDAVERFRDRGLEVLWPGEESTKEVAVA